MMAKINSDEPIPMRAAWRSGSWTGTCSGTPTWLTQSQYSRRLLRSDGMSGVYQHGFTDGFKLVDDQEKPGGYGTACTFGDQQERPNRPAVAGDGPFRQ